MLYYGSNKINSDMATIKTVLRKTKLDNNKFPIYLRVTHLRKSKFFRTPFNSTLKEWNEKTGEFNSKNDNAIQNNRVLNKFKSRVLKIINDFEIEDKDFSFKVLEHELRLIYNPLQNNFFNFFNSITQEMLDSNRIGSADVNKYTSLSLLMFNNNSSDLNFEEVDADFLYRYEVFLRSRGGTDGGIGVKMRAIRAVYNLAIARNFTKENNYPFKKYKVSKLKSKGQKRALSAADLSKITKLDYAKHPHLIYARDYFLFSYYTRGMNFADMLKLKWSDISDGRIFYTRSKTQANFSIKILEPVKLILESYKAQNLPTPYVFPILLKEKLTPMQIKYRKHKVLRRFNKDLKEIGELCGINQNLTSYVARHTFANTMRKNGSSTEIISASLGHKELSTTKAYLKELESPELDEACELLVQQITE